MKSFITLTPIALLALVANAQESVLKYSEGLQLYKADAALVTKVIPAINGITGSIRDLKAVSKLERIKKGLSDEGAIIFSKKITLDEKVWNRVVFRKNKKNYAAARIQAKCRSGKKVEPVQVKKALRKSLKTGKYYKVKCNGKISALKN